MDDVLTGEVPEGGLARWAPKVVPSPVSLSNEQALACAFRVLAGTGFSENIGGHITWVDSAEGADAPEGSMLVNPWGLWWEEVAASDLCRVDVDARPLSGRWDVTPAIHIHTELHRARPDARVIVHNHPYHVTVLTALGLLPDVFHQTGSMFEGDLRFVAEYDGEVDEPRKGAELAEEVGDGSVVFLANHGVIVTGPTLADAVYRAASIDRACRLAIDVVRYARPATTVAPTLRRALKASLLERAADVYWAGAVRQLLKRDPEVLL